VSELSAVVVVLGVVAASCGGELIRGGRIVAPGNEPPGSARCEFERRQCRDLGREPVELARTAKAIVVVNGDALMLLETRPGYDSLVIDNRFSDGRDTVFQAVVATDEGKLLYSLELPACGGGSSGTLSIARIWDEQSLPGGGFKATTQLPIATCDLVQTEPEDVDKPLSLR
jgi:hypothetical protein